MKTVYDLYHWHHPDAAAVLHRDFDTMAAAMNAIPAIEHDRYPRQRVTDHAAAAQAENWQPVPREGDEAGWLLNETHTGGSRVWGIFERLVGETDGERVELALELLAEFGQVEGSHHQAWTIDQVTRVLTGDRYEAFVAEYVSEDGDGVPMYTWNEGVAP